MGQEWLCRRGGPQEWGGFMTGSRGCHGTVERATIGDFLPK